MLLAKELIEYETWFSLSMFASSAFMWLIILGGTCLSSCVSDYYDSHFKMVENFPNNTFACNVSHIFISSFSISVTRIKYL